MKRPAYRRIEWTRREAGLNLAAATISAIAAVFGLLG